MMCSLILVLYLGMADQKERTIAERLWCIECIARAAAQVAQYQKRNPYFPVGMRCEPSIGIRI